MKTNRLLSLMLFCTAMLFAGRLGAQNSFDRQAYFAAFAEAKAPGIEKQLTKVASLGGTDQQAFEGALLMRKAGLQSNVMQKLSFFKNGAKMLEAAIKAQPQNAEYRFLRLMIQENAPKIVGYDGDLEADAAFIKAKSATVDLATKKAISNYARVSKRL